MALRSTRHEAWVEDAAQELLTKVMWWDKDTMKDYNTQKVPEVAEIVAQMGASVEEVIEAWPFSPCFFPFFPMFPWFSVCFPCVATP